MMKKIPTGHFIEPSGIGGSQREHILALVRCQPTVTGERDRGREGARMVGEEERERQRVS